jgi:hypothetical protein
VVYEVVARKWEMWKRPVSLVADLVDDSFELLHMLLG